jgi:hypothetical protein
MIAWFIRVDIIDNNRNRRRIAQLEAELDFSKRQVGTMRKNSLSTFSITAASNAKRESELVA